MIDNSKNEVEEIINKYSSMVYKLIYCHIQIKSYVDDIFQEVFLKYIKYNKPFTNEEHRKAWIIRVTINCCYSLNSSSWLKKTVTLEDNLYEHIDEKTDNKIDMQRLLLKIPEKYRTVIHLFYYEDLSVEQISFILKIKHSTVRTQLTRARAMLKDLMEGEDDFERKG